MDIYIHTPDYQYSCAPNTPPPPPAALGAFSYIPPIPSKCLLQSTFLFLKLSRRNCCVVSKRNCTTRLPDGFRAQDRAALHAPYYEGRGGDGLEGDSSADSSDDDRPGGRSGGKSGNKSGGSDGGSGAVAVAAKRRRDEDSGCGSRGEAAGGGGVEGEGDARKRATREGNQVRGGRGKGFRNRKAGWGLGGEGGGVHAGACRGDCPWASYPRQSRCRTGFWTLQESCMSQGYAVLPAALRV